MFKWICLLVAIAALGGLGWMLNDMRMEVQVPALKADRLADKADALLAKMDQQLPRHAWFQDGESHRAALTGTCRASPCRPRRRPR